MPQYYAPKKCKMVSQSDAKGWATLGHLDAFLNDIRDELSQDFEKQDAKESPRYPRVFFSYAWEREGSVRLKNLHNFLRMLAYHIEKTGMQVFFDLKNMAANMERKMRYGIEQSDLVLLFGTRTYAEKTSIDADTNVRRELEYALARVAHQGLPKVMPILLEGDTYSTFHSLLDQDELLQQNKKKIEQLVVPATSLIDLDTGEYSMREYIGVLTAVEEPVCILPVALNLDDYGDSYGPLERKLGLAYGRCHDLLMSRVNETYPVGTQKICFRKQDHKRFTQVVLRASLPLVALVALVGLVLAWLYNRKSIDIKQRLKKSYQESPSITDIKLLFHDAHFSQEKFIPIQLKFESKSIDAKDIFKNHSVVIVSTDPGYGKSTWFRHITFLWNTDKLWNDKFDLLFLISLPDLVEYYEARLKHGKTLTVEDAIAEFCLTSERQRSVEGYQPSSTISESELGDIRQYLKTHANRILFVLDAYDEVHDKLRNMTLDDAIHAFFQKKNILISTRTYHLNTLRLDRDLKNRKPMVLSITGFDSRERTAYVNNFLHLVCPDADEEQKKEFIQSFAEYFFSNARFAESVKKPLELQFLCDFWYDAFGRAKEKQAVLGLEEMKVISATSIYRTVTVSMAKRFLNTTKRASKTWLASAEDEDVFNDNVTNIPLILGFLKRFAKNGGSNGQELAVTYAAENTVTFADLKSGIVGLGLVSGDKCGGSAGCHYYFLHQSFQEFFLGWDLANRLLKGEPSAVLPSQYHLRHDRVKWFGKDIEQLVYAVGTLCITKQAQALEPFLYYLLSKETEDKESEKVWSSTGGNINQYTLPLSIELFEEIIFDEKEKSEYGWFDTIRKEIFKLVRENINSLLKDYSLAELDEDTKKFITAMIGAIKKSVRMKHEIVQENFALVLTTGFQRLNEIKVMRDLDYLTDKIIQHLITALSNPGLRNEAKEMLIHARVENNTIYSELYKEDDPVDVTKAKASILLELGYVDEDFFPKLKTKGENEKLRNLVVTIMGVIATQQKKEEMFGGLLNMLQYPDCVDAIQNVLFDLQYFNEPSKLDLFGKKIAKLLNEKKADHGFVDAYLQVLNNLDKLNKAFLKSIMGENSALLKEIEDFLPEQSTADFPTIKSALSLIAKIGTTPKSLSILINHAHFTIAGKEALVSDIRAIAIKGLDNFKLTHAKQVWDCLKKRLLDPKETESNKKAATKIILGINLESIWHSTTVENNSTVVANSIKLEINEVLLSRFLFVTPEEQKLIAQKIQPAEINYHISESLKNILADYEKNRALETHKQIILTLVSNTSQNVIQNLLQNPDSFIYELPECGFFNDKIAIAFCTILSSSENLFLRVRAQFVFGQLLMNSREELYKTMTSSPENKKLFLKALFALHKEGGLYCDTDTLFILIKLLETDLDNIPNSKKSVCEILDAWYKGERNFKQALANLKGKGLSFLSQIDSYYYPWFPSLSSTTLYDTIKQDPLFSRNPPPMTSSVMHSRPLPIWMIKPFSMTGRFIGDVVGQLKTVTSGFVDFADDVRSRALVEPALIAPVPTQENAENQQTTGQRVTSNASASHSMPSYGTLAQIMVVPALNRFSKLHGLFGYRAVSLAQNQVQQYKDELKEIAVSLSRMEDHPILGRRLEYRIAQAALEQATLCCRNAFRCSLPQNDTITVTESDHAKVKQSLKILEQSLSVLEELQVQCDTFSQALTEIVEAKVFVRKELEKMRYDEEREELYEAVDYLLSKIDVQLEVSCLNENLPCIQGQLNLLKEAIQQAAEAGKLVEQRVIAMADTLRNQEFMQIHGQENIGKTVLFETECRSAVLTDFFVVNPTRDELPSVGGPRSLLSR